MKIKPVTVLGDPHKAHTLITAMVSKKTDKAVVLQPSLSFLMAKFGYTKDEALKLLGSK
jgi:hypothetical protein